MEYSHFLLLGSWPLKKGLALHVASGHCTAFSVCTPPPPTSLEDQDFIGEKVVPLVMATAEEERSSLFRRHTREPGSGRQPNQAAVGTKSEEEMLKENNAIVAALMEDVRALKRASKAVQEEVKTHVRFLDRLQDITSNAKDQVKRVLGKVDEVSGFSSVGHMWLLFLVAFVVCIYLYFLLRHRG